MNCASAAALILPDRPAAAPALPTPTIPQPIEQSAPPSAIAKRAAHPLLTSLFSVNSLLPQLPLAFPADPDAQPCPKRRFRSHYRYLGPQALLDPTERAHLSDFQISIYLIDYSGLRDELARIYRPSHKGQVPFDPVSMMLAITLRIEERKSWQATANALTGKGGAGWRELFGFEEGATPSASALRDFFRKVGPAFFAELCPRSIELLRQHHLFPERSTYPGDPEDRGITVSQDGMLHAACSRPSCQLATEECYRPLASTPEPAGEAGAEAASAEAGLADRGEGTVGSRRRCRAQAKGLAGCQCNGPECTQQCRRASRLDPEARFIHYRGHNDKHGQERSSEQGGGGIDCFGYRSIVDRALDDRFAIAWTLRSRLYPANTDERTVFKLELEQLKRRFWELKIGEWLDDSGVGYGECLDAVWELGALRMVDIREDAGDNDFESCLRRGYDGKGRPLCPHGYPLSPNGYDYERRRAKYVCNQICRRAPLREEGPVQPVEGCPYLDQAHPLGQVQNLGRAFKDGSVRLAREIPYGSDSWKARYGRRNLSESRNGQIEGLGLKRMKSYGLERCQKELQLADFLLNLRTLGRLVREATSRLQG